MLNKISQQVQKPRKPGAKLFERGTPWSINRRVLDRLYDDVTLKIIPIKILIEIARDMREALYGARAP
jgi:hypothetical protein